MRFFGIFLISASSLAHPALSEAPDSSVRPQQRPFVTVAQTEAQVIRAVVDMSAVDGATTGVRPQMRPAGLITRDRTENVTQVAARPAGFDRWIESFRRRAAAEGVPASLFDRAFAQVEYLPEVIRLDGKQSEFTKSTGEYLASAVSDTRVSNGRSEFRSNAEIFDAVQRSYGVPAQYVAAIWGMETNYGTFRGNTNILSAMTTLAFDGRRKSFFEDQLIAALKILQSGDTTPDAMTGSWAGAMGHTQFMPTSYLDYAVDITGDGRRDIWSDNPADALASSAAYLKRFGWVAGMPWGYEVVLPAGFNFTQANGPQKMPSEWARLGVRPADGSAVRDYGAARLILPAGAQGAAFLVFKNFDVIKRYNNSDAYALAVGHLGDRIAGAGPLRGGWPEGERALKRAEREEIQQRLTAKGFSTGGVDGRIGPMTVNAIREYQQAVGMQPDGHPSIALLSRLRS